MKQTNDKQRRRSAMLMGLLALSSQTDAFTNLNPARTPRSLSPVLETEPLVGSELLVKPEAHANTKLKLFKDDKSWTETAGNVGRRAWNLIKKGGTKLKDLAVEGTKSIKTALFDDDHNKTPKGNEAFQGYATPPLVDTEDEDLFRSIFKNEDDIPDPLATSNALERVVDGAAQLIQQNAVAAAVLGDSIQHSFPISQSTESTMVDGKRTTAMETTFQAWGLRGQGLAFVTAVDGELLSLDLEVDGQTLPIYPAAPGATNNPNTSQTQTPKAWEPEDIETVLEVEVMHGVRRLNPPKGGDILDAEILDKKFTM